jgi:flagellar biosynthesis/type III secretory pathway chaperone
MASLWKQILEEEVEQLEHLKGLMREEKECLHRMDREGLLRLAREKEALARRMRKLNSRKEQLQDENRDASSSAQGVSDLYHARNTLLQELREMTRTQKEIIDTQRDQVGQLLAFIQNLRCPSTTYDCTGNLR